MSFALGNGCHLQIRYGNNLRKDVDIFTMSASHVALGECAFEGIL